MHLAAYIFFAIYTIMYRLDFTLSCNQPYTQRTLLEGYHCVGGRNDTFMKNVSYLNKWECVIVCQHLKECRFLHYNVNGKYCLLSKKLCTDLNPNINYMVSAFGPDHSDCFNWKTTDWSTFENGIEVQRPGTTSQFVSRTYADGHWYPARAGTKKCRTVVNDEKLISTDCDILEVSEPCVSYLSWIFFRKGDGGALPLGAVVGGYHPDGHPLFIAKVITQDMDISIGYYDDQSGLGYCVVSSEVQESTDVYILTLFWHSHKIIISNATVRNKPQDVNVSIMEYGRWIWDIISQKPSRKIQPACTCFAMI